MKSTYVPQVMQMPYNLFCLPIQVMQLCLSFHTMQQFVHWIPDKSTLDLMTFHKSEKKNNNYKMRNKREIMG